MMTRTAVAFLALDLWGTIILVGMTDWIGTSTYNNNTLPLKLGNLKWLLVSYDYPLSSLLISCQVERDGIF